MQTEINVLFPVVESSFLPACLRELGNDACDDADTADGDDWTICSLNL